MMRIFYIVADQYLIKFPYKLELKSKPRKIEPVYKILGKIVDKYA
jgi:hypothetical protein